MENISTLAIIVIVIAIVVVVFVWFFRRRYISEIESRKVLKILKSVGAVITDSHIVYTSWKHGPVYIDKREVYPYTIETYTICRFIARRFKYYDIDTVVGPALGGIVLSQWVAYRLSRIKGQNVFSVYAEKTKDETSFFIRKNYQKFITGKNVLVVEDILNTGGSAQKVIDVVREAGGNVVGVGVLCNRGGVTVKDLGDVPRLDALVNISLDAWDEEECPLCKGDVPINTDVGKGKEFLAQKEK